MQTTERNSKVFFLLIGIAEIAIGGLMLLVVCLIALRMFREGEHSPHFLYLITPIVLIGNGLLVIVRNKIAIYALCCFATIGGYLSLRYAIELGLNPATPIYLFFGVLCGGVLAGAFYFKK